MGEVWTAAGRYSIGQAPDVVEPPHHGDHAGHPRDPHPHAHPARRQPTFTLGYGLRNVGYLPFDYNWGIHPCLAVRPTWRFDIPATRGLVNEAGGGLLGQPGDEYTWPVIGGVDLRQAMKPDRGAFALHYLTGLTAGWIAATDTADRRGFGLCFDADLFPVVWFCLVYGGWRGYYQALVEPWTRLPEPARRGGAGRPGPHPRARPDAAH